MVVSFYGCLLFSQSCHLLLCVMLVQFYALLCKQTRALAWSELKITSKQNNIFFFLYLNRFIDPGCSSVVGGVKCRWVYGWWGMGRSKWESSGWVCMQELTCAAKRSFLPWQGREGRCLWRPPEGDPVHLSWGASTLKAIHNRADSIIIITSKFCSSSCSSTSKKKVKIKIKWINFPWKKYVSCQVTIKFLV